MKLIWWYTDKNKHKTRNYIKKLRTFYLPHTSHYSMHFEQILPFDRFDKFFILFYVCVYRKFKKTQKKRIINSIRYYMWLFICIIRYHFHCPLTFYLTKLARNEFPKSEFCSKYVTAQISFKNIYIESLMK